jgi:hypothetical protein
VNLWKPNLIKQTHKLSKIQNTMRYNESHYRKKVICFIEKAIISQAIDTSIEGSETTGEVEPS